MPLLSCLAPSKSLDTSSHVMLILSYSCIHQRLIKTSKCFRHWGYRNEQTSSLLSCSLHSAENWERLTKTITHLRWFQRVLRALRKQNTWCDGKCLGTETEQNPAGALPHTKAPLCPPPPFLFVEKGLSLLGLLGVPKSGLKQLLIRVNAETKGKRSRNDSSGIKPSPSSSSKGMHDNLIQIFELFFRD